MTTPLPASGLGSDIPVSIRVQSGKQRRCMLWDKRFSIGIRSYTMAGTFGEVKIWHGGFVASEHQSLLLKHWRGKIKAENAGKS